MKNKQLARHFQACEYMMSSLTTKAVSEIEIMPTDHVRSPAERTLTM